MNLSGETGECPGLTYIPNGFFVILDRALSIGDANDASLEGLAVGVVFIVSEVEGIFSSLLIFKEKRSIVNTASRKADI